MTINKVAEMRTLASQLRGDVDVFWEQTHETMVPAALATTIAVNLFGLVHRTADLLDLVADGIEKGEIVAAWDERGYADFLDPEFPVALRYLRAINHLATMSVTNMLGGVHVARRLLSNIAPAGK